MASGDVYVIWSYEHGAWWRPDRCGYTPDLREAGHYTQHEAAAIVADANVVRLEEVMVTLTTAMTRPWDDTSPENLLQEIAWLPPDQQTLVFALLRAWTHNTKETR